MPPHDSQSPSSALVLDGSELALAELLEDAQRYAQAGTTEGTKAAYGRYWKGFIAWADAHDAQPLPAAPQTVALFLTELANRGLAAATLDFALVAISRAHKRAGFDSPTSSTVVSEVRKGIRRQIGTGQDQKAALLIEDLRRMIEALPSGLQGTRDRALLLIGFAGAFRRCELVALEVDDVEIVSQGMRVHIRRSKTDQEAAGRIIGIPNGRAELTCPVQTLTQWLQEARIHEGPIFRGIDRHGGIKPKGLTPQSVALVVKKAAKRVGLDPKRFAGHSLRSGLATSAARAGVQDRVIAQQTGHRSMKVLGRYIREGKLFEENAAGEVGL